MSFSTNWDVDKYYDPSEFNEHWKLRKEFMLTHKTKFPEDRLAALAKIFYNMEFLGCIYNSEVMILVQNLAEQVDAIVNYRDKKKIKLQRTFVKASDAVKRHIEKSDATSFKMKYVSFVPAKNPEDDDDDDDDDEIEAKRRKMDLFINRPELKKYADIITNPKQDSNETLNEPEPPFVRIGDGYLTKNQFMPPGYQEPTKPQQQQLPQPLYNYQQHTTIVKGVLSKTQQKKLAKQQIQKRNQQNNRFKLRFDLKPEDRELIMKVQKQNGVLGKLVLYETKTHATPYGRLDYAASKVNINMKIVKDEINKKYILYMDDEHITEIPISDQPPVTRRVPKGHRKFKIPEDARNEIAENAIDYFKKYCFTLIDHDTKDTEQISTDNLKNRSRPNKNFELSMDGIGAKMMKQMGWGGKGLGKDSNGILEPIQAQIRVYRRGFGQGSNEAFTKSVREYFENYLASGETKRLVFSMDFSKEDRAKLHGIAGQYGLLKSRSYGRGENRHITIERKLRSWDIIEQVMANGGSNDSYTLIKPTNI